MIASNRTLFGGQISRRGNRTSGARKRRLLLRSAEGLEEDKRIPLEWKPVDLVVTSPPYMGVHMLYHRWQVMSRRETPAAYWIAGLEDGHPASHYTFGARRQTEWATYLSRLSRTFLSISRMLSEKGIVIQLVGFSTPELQLDRYLDVMSAVGLEEVDLTRGLQKAERRLWRSVPNRRWYAGMHPLTDPSREILLVHRKTGG
jgi:DNA modification methylase